MAKEWAKPFYNSKAWKEARDAYIRQRVAIDGGLCQTCHEAPGFIVHHKIALTPDNIDNPDITLNLENYRYDCKSCHDQEESHSGWHRKEKLLVEFDSSGQPIRKLEKNSYPPCQL